MKGTVDKLLNFMKLSDDEEYDEEYEEYEDCLLYTSPSPRD